MKGLMAFTALVPIGLAWALMRDEYDERVLGKKQNVMGFGQENNGLAVLDMTARAGTFGIGGDFFNAIFNQDINRDFSLDSRIFFVSTLLNSARTIGTWIRQGDATYATVMRPLIQAMGGSGYLQTADALNNALSLDNAESRSVARINVTNYLRAIGRTLNLNVRSGRGMSSTPNSIKPWVGEMVLSAYANDNVAFSRAFQKAVQAARDEGKPDPADHVKRSYQGVNPLRTVFRTMPSEAEYRRMLAALPDSGRIAVSEALTRYNRFAQRLGLKPSFGKQTSSRGSTSLDAIRRRASTIGL